MTRCRAVHDWNPGRAIGIRCTRTEGHSGEHRTAGWEAMGRQAYEYLTSRKTVKAAK